MRRHELRSTLMTSNRPLEDWGKFIPAAAAILESLPVIEIGKSYRRVANAPRNHPAKPDRVGATTAK